MNSKIINVFYDEYGYPFKDQERSVRFPVIGSGFMGASNTTQIKFYFKEIGDDAVKWVAVSKLPNGKVGSKVLENYYDSELDEPYALLELDSYYTQYKGDLFISLQGYQGGVQVTYDEDTELYEIEGTPTIQATGSIKFTNNYATQFVGSGEEQNITLQQLLAIISDTVLRYYVNSSNTLAEVFNEIGTKICAIDIEGDEYLCEMSGDTNIVIYDIHNQEWYAFSGANTTTIDSVLQYSNKQIIATKEDLENFGNLFTYKGTASVSKINVLTNIGNGWCYNLTDSGTLTLGNLQVETGDNVAFNGTIWTKLSSETILGQYYTKQEGQAFEQNVNNQISNIENQVQQVASGSPKGVYATLSDLETAYPTGTTGIYVVSADGHWYYWNGSAWTDGGVYLSSLPDDKLSKTSTNSVENKVISSQLLDLISEDYTQVLEGEDIFTIGGYAQPDGSLVAAGSGWLRTDYIEVDDFTNAIYFNLVGYQNFVCIVAFYDENKVFISNGSVIGTTTPTSGHLLIPENAKYVILSTQSVINVDQNYNCAFLILCGKKETLRNRVEALSNKIIIQNTKTISDFQFGNYGFLNTSGILGSQNNTGWLTSIFYKVIGGTKLTYQGIFGYESLVTNIAFYDEDLVFISNGSFVASDVYEKQGTLTVPANAKYMRICTNGSRDTSLLSISYYEEKYINEVLLNDILPSLFNASPKLYNKKIMLYGDSIFSNDYVWLKEALEKLTGSIVYAGGWSGENAASIASPSRLQRILDYKPDILIIMTGGNDTGVSGTVGTLGTYGGLLESEEEVSLPDINSAYSGTKFIEAVAYIAQFCMYHIAGFRHNLYLEGECTDVGSALNEETDLDNVSKPIVILCTSLPQQRVDNSNPFSNPKNNVRKADAIREVARYLHIPLIDFSVLCGFDMINESYPESPTDKVHNKGTYMMDGVHPNKFGYTRLAKIISRFLTLYVTDDDLRDIIS